MSPPAGLEPALAELGIRLRRETPGEHRTACPECAGAKPRPGDDALAVKLEPDGGATWCCHRCGWSGGLAPPGRERAVPRRPAPPPKPAAPDPAVERNRQLAQEIWRGSTTISPGTALPWRYLTETRGITRWDHERLLWHPACPWGDRRVGCIVAPVNDHATHLVVGVWRIRPALEGPVERMGLGPTKGNASRLFPAPGTALAVAEGVEDALAAAELTGLPCWAALSAGNMAALVLPERFREVLIIADRDKHGKGQEKAHALAARLRAEGRHAEVRRSTVGKDANDALRARRAG